MPRPLLPPRGVFVPTAIAYNHEMPASVALTWIQLRGLAWSESETPPLSMGQLADLTGKSPSTLYGHMALLRQWGALRWRPSEKGTFIVSFEADPEGEPGDPPRIPTQGDSRFWDTSVRDTSVRDSEKPEKPDPPSSQLNQLINLEEGLREGGFRDLEIRDSGIRDSRIRESRIQNSVNLENEPVKRYQSQTGIRPNRAQREQLKNQVDDFDRWDATLEHWQAHGWNPRNIAGMLELYERGGPAACRYCKKSTTPQGQSLAALEQLRQELPPPRLVEPGDGPAPEERGDGRG